jgi:hypothetical protein
MYYGGPYFLTVVWFGSSPTHAQCTLPPSVRSTGDTGSLKKKDNLPTVGGGGEPQTIRRQENVVLCTKLNTLWLHFVLVHSVEGGMHLSWTRYFGNLWGWGVQEQCSPVPDTAPISILWSLMCSSAVNSTVHSLMFRYQYSGPRCAFLLYTVRTYSVYAPISILCRWLQLAQLAKGKKSRP